MKDLFVREFTWDELMQIEFALMERICDKRKRLKNYKGDYKKSLEVDLLFLEKLLDKVRNT